MLPVWMDNLIAPARTLMCRVLALATLAVVPSRIVDAAGTPFRLKRWEIMKALVQHSRGMTRRRQHVPYTQTLRAVPVIDVLLVIAPILIGLIGCIVIPFLALTGAMSGQEFPRALAVLVFGCASSLWRSYGFLPNDHAKLASRIIMLGRCPACGQSLRGVPAGSNSLTKCPECAAQWENVALAATLGDTQA